MMWIWKNAIWPVFNIILMALGFVGIGFVFLAPFFYTSYLVEEYSPWFILIWLIWPMILTGLFNLVKENVQP